MTMPVTLAAVAAVLPRGSEGFAFGLTCLALFCGSVPSLHRAAAGLRALAAGGAHPAGGRGALVRARRPRPALAAGHRVARPGREGGRS